MLEIHCTGSPREIGYIHGSQAKRQVAGSIAFYRKLFAEKCAMDWDQVTHEAEKYIQPLQTTSTCRRYLEEIEGLAAGAEVSTLDVLALNVRTEIMFGLFSEQTPTKSDVNNNMNTEQRVSARVRNNDIPSDGCTSAAWVDGPTGQSFLAQNWDWQKAQGSNLVVCHVEPSSPAAPADASNGDASLSSSSSSLSPSSPVRFSMVTEAGIIGKIGFNAHGVGCCLNAIRARGVDPSKLPVHFALRTVLESRSRDEAIARLERHGVAGSAHILVADAETGAMGLECSPVSGIRRIAMDADRRVHHTNHLLLEHPGVEEPAWLEDSQHRLDRIKALLAEKAATASAPSCVEFGSLLEMFKDEDRFPCAINRKEVGESTFETLFTIIMNLSRKEALVKFGRPTEEGPQVKLKL